MVAICNLRRIIMNKIILRPWKPDDAAQLTFIANNRKVWNNLRDRLPHPYTRNDAANWIKFCQNQYPAQNFAVAYNKLVIGSAGLIIKDDVYKKNIEIGYFIGEPYQGKGAASEAVRLLLEYIEKNFDAVRIYAEVFAHNKASMRVLQKNGFYLEGIRRKSAFKNGELVDEYVWVRFKP